MSRSLRATSAREKEEKMGVNEGERASELNSGRNWRNVLTDFAAMSGILAGFSITFVVLILGGSVGDSLLFPQYVEFKVTYGHIAVLFLGISAALFVTAAQFFLLSREFDVYDIPERYREVLKHRYGRTEGEWERFEKESDSKCHKYESSGRNLYNKAVFMIWIGVGSAIWSYNWLVALGVTVLGIVLEFWQTYGQK